MYSKKTCVPHLQLLKSINYQSDERRHAVDSVQQSCDIFTILHIYACVTKTIPLKLFNSSNLKPFIHQQIHFAGTAISSIDCRSLWLPVEKPWFML